MRTAATIFVFCTVLLCCSACGSGAGETSNDESQEVSLASGNEIIASQLMDYSEMLGRGEGDLVTQKGEGDIHVDEHGNVASRSYDENVLGFLGTVFYIFGEGDGQLIVDEVIVFFRGVTFNDAVTGISQQLGDAISLENQGDAADAEWNCFHCNYHLAKYENALMLSVTKA